MRAGRSQACSRHSETIVQTSPTHAILFAVIGALSARFALETAVMLVAQSEIEFALGSCKGRARPCAGDLSLSLRGFARVRVYASA